MRNRYWIPLSLAALTVAQVAIWLVMVNATQDRLEGDTRERLPLIAKALREDALCVELHAQRSLPGGSSFFLLGPGGQQHGMDTIADYDVVSGRSLAAVRLPRIPLDLPCAVDIDLRFRFMMPPDAATDTTPSDLRQQLASDLSTALWTQKGSHRLKLLDTTLLAQLVRDKLLVPQLGDVEYAVVDTATGRVLHASTGADVARVLGHGTRQPIFLRDQPGIPLALCVLFPHARIGVLTDRAPLLLGMLGLLVLLVIGVRQYVRSAHEQRKLADMQMDLMSNITHELNTPITNIALALETLKKDPAGTSRISNDRLWDIIHVEHQRLQAHVRKVLDVSMLEGRQLLMDPEVHDVHGILDSAADGFALALARHGATLEKKYLSSNSWVRADATYLGNVFQALIDNAIKYGGPGVSIRLRTSDVEDGVLIEVDDNGPGIPPAEREHVFEKFYRIRQQDRYAVKGTGIGLYHARKVLESCGGSIRLDHRDGRSACFRIFLPNEANEHAATAHR